MQKRRKKGFDVCIIGGAGHVGLPLGVMMALSGFKVALLDINKQALSLINKGTFPFKEDGGDQALRKALKSGNLLATSTPSVISKSDVVTLIIGTPVDQYLNPKMDDLMRVIEKYRPLFRRGQTLMLRSTVFPGTSEVIQRHLDSKKTGVQVAFCPERIVEGKALHELGHMPQIVSAFAPEAIEKMKEIFGKVSTSGVIVTEPIEAELAKLFSNAWRYIKFSVANQFYMMATDRGVNYAKVYNAMTDRYERNKDLPKPGFAAGPCLFKDTMQLAAFNQNRFFLGHAAMLINEGMPRFVLEQVKGLVSDIHTKTIGILGMTFKSESDDIRDSLSFKLRKLANLEAKEVLVHDYYYKDSSFSTLDRVLKRSDIIIVATPHKKYADIPKSKLKGKVVVDIWNHLK